MRPKDIQEKLGIDADRIKLFKREGIFFPENPVSGKKGTNYTERDLERLRLIVVLTKSGLTCSDIRKMQEGECSLQEVIISRKNKIENEIIRKESALLMLAEILDDKADFETFKTDYYWDAISRREIAGEEFVDIGEMYEYQSVSLIRNICCPYCNEEYEVDLEDYMYDQSSDEKENGMGPDIVYSFNSENCYECPNCRCGIQIEGWIREYPIGAYDSEDINIMTLSEDNEEE